MTNSINLPYLDQTGKLTPLVVEAMANGATSAHHPDDADQIVLTFTDDADPILAQLQAIMSPPAPVKVQAKRSKDGGE